MNAIAFGTKRTFHSFLRITRKALASFGLTAARFDMLSALKGYMFRHQTELRRALGVSASVVSRMLDALEALGLVERTVDRTDRRRRFVELTKRGEACIAAAAKALLRPVRRLVFMAICFGKHRDPNQVFLRMEALESALRVLRRDFGDTATLYYPWGHPDD
jgi:DNA-binding MarR family transcriptional regulator